ncbi:hypothetical protein [Paraburkholderia sp. BL6669N2]|uniref:hypothetical protein n=1 Tax=Paraburkholderia sp. BL6669N2 TaxID=1938807 RepID=UPI0011C01B6C|nr:hypothetical protein [Paraburkholderia sp. BL6669N2]
MISFRLLPYWNVISALHPVDPSAGASSIRECTQRALGPVARFLVLFYGLFDDKPLPHCLAIYPAHTVKTLGDIDAWQTGGYPRAPCGSAKTEITAYVQSKKSKHSPKPS